MKIKSRKEFCTVFAGPTGWLNRHHKLDLLNKFFPIKKTLTKNDIINDAKKYSTKKEWYTKSRSKYTKASENGWIKEASRHMSQSITNWTYDKCLKEAKRYKRVGEWKKNHNKSYDAAVRNNWIQDIKNKAELVSKDVKKIKNLNTGEIFESGADAAKKYSLPKCSVYNSARKGYQAGGYNWAYCDEDGNVIPNETESKSS
jgi:hypothetical protein